MRKALVIALSILLSSALCASSVTFDSSVPDDIAAVIDDGIRRWTEGRGDIQVEVGGYSEDDTLFEGRIFASFTASSGGSSYDIRAVGEGREGLEEAVADEVRNILFYEESFMAPSPRLDYIYRGSYSFLSDSYYRRGTRLSAVDGDDIADRGQRKNLLRNIILQAASGGDENSAFGGGALKDASGMRGDDLAAVQKRSIQIESDKSDIHKKTSV